MNNKLKFDDNNIITLTDGYKLTHWMDYPDDLQGVFSYYENRVGSKYDSSTFVGLQYYLIKYLEGVVVTPDKIAEAKLLSAGYFGTEDNFNEEMWVHIWEEYEGKLPIRIKAVDEGATVPVNNVLMTIENLDDKCAPLTNALETILMHVWSASNVATIGTYLKKDMISLLMKTHSKSYEECLAIANFMLHDFGFRGVSSVESSAFCGFGHFANFLGTDTLSAVILAMNYYGSSVNDTAFSVPATEHSVMTSKGPDGELDIIRDIIRKHNTGIVSCVADSYSITRFVQEYMPLLKDEILARKPNAIGACKFVVRPDSLRAPDDTPEDQTLWIVEELAKTFGYTVNDFGYKVLNPKIGVLWGDGIGPDGILRIMLKVADAGWDISCLVFGMGGGLLQKHNRDTQRVAIKCSAQKYDGKWVDIQKDPLDKSKKSKKGRVVLGIVAGVGVVTVAEDSEEAKDLVDNEVFKLHLRFESGEIYRRQTLEGIRRLAANMLKQIVT